MSRFGKLFLISNYAINDLFVVEKLVNYYWTLKNSTQKTEINFTNVKN